MGKSNLAKREDDVSLEFTKTPDEAKELWTAALRSDQYKQGHMYLCCRNRYCCLGVAIEVAMENEPAIKKRLMKKTAVDQDVNPMVTRHLYIDKKTKDECDVDLPHVVQRWLNLFDSYGSLRKDADPHPTDHSLYALNDWERWNFRQIANFIDENWQGLQVKDEEGQRMAHSA